MRKILTSAVIGSLLAMGSGLACPENASAQDSVQAYQIPPGDLDSALRQYASLNRTQLIYSADSVRGKKSNGLTGNHAPQDALQKLLAGSGLQAEVINSKTIALKPVPKEVRATRPQSSQSRADSSADRDIVGMPAIMVKGARTLNMDIERMVDDPQPYVTFDRIALERSGASSLDDFLRTRLPMNSSTMSASQQGADRGNVSRVNLRGLGETQTLILVDGRRLATTSPGATSGQPDINGIPIQAIERIEVLPATASAIYGGKATGGVINVILRREYQGAEVTFTYDNSFDTDSAVKRIDLSSGFSLFGGRTSVLLTGSYSESNELLTRDRNLLRRGWERQLENNPSLHEFFEAVGSGANISSASGEDLVMKDGRALGSPFTSAPAGYGGVATDGGAALLGNAGTYNLDYGDTAAMYQGGGVALIPKNLVKYFSGSLNHEFSGSLRGFLDASRSENITRRQYGETLYVDLPASAPTNPFNQDLVVTTSARSLDALSLVESTYDRFSGGLVFDLPRQWMGAADYTYTRSDLRSMRGLAIDEDAMNTAIADGTLDVLADLSQVDMSDYILGIGNRNSPIEVITKNPVVRISGPLGSLKGGNPHVSFLLERQDTRFGAGTMHSYFRGDPLLVLFPERSQKIDSAYVELRVPLLSSRNELAWAKELELQLASRWDRYQSVNAAHIQIIGDGTPGPFAYVRNEITEFSPLLAVKFRPLDSLAVRASYSEGFLPADINQMTAPVVSTGSLARLFFADPLRDNVTRQHALDYTITGGNPDLKPEYSTNWSLGVIYTPTWLSGFRLSVDYVNLVKDGNIISLTQQLLIDNEQYFPGRVVRGPNLPTDPPGWAGPVIGMDRGFINAATAKLESFDIQMDYTLFRDDGGSFNVFAIANYQTRYDVKAVPSAPYVDNIDVVFNYNSVPLKLKGNFGVTWNSNPWTVGWTARYASSYYVANPASAASMSSLLAQGNHGRVPSQVYHDVFAKYLFGHGGREGRAAGLLEGLELQVGIRNVLNKTPPYDYSNYVGYYSAVGDPRLASYYITLRKSF